MGSNISGIHCETEAIAGDITSPAPDNGHRIVRCVSFYSTLTYCCISTRLFLDEN